jgi:hypothetical protein
MCTDAIFWDVSKATKMPCEARGAKRDLGDTSLPGQISLRRNPS